MPSEAILGKVNEYDVRKQHRGIAASRRTGSR
jgi:hypothetical protein